MATCSERNQLTKDTHYKVNTDSWAVTDNVAEWLGYGSGDKGFMVWFLAAARYLSSWKHSDLLSCQQRRYFPGDKAQLYLYFLTCLHDIVFNFIKAQISCTSLCSQNLYENILMWRLLPEFCKPHFSLKIVLNDRHPNYKIFMNLICKILSLLIMRAQYTR